MIQTDYILQNAYSLCSGIEDQRYIAVCYKGIAAHLTKDNFDVLDNTRLMCLSTPPQYKEQCVLGAIESLTRFVSDDKASEFCQSLDDDLQKTCQDRMNSLIDIMYD